MTPFELSVRFFLQLAVILLACRAVGWIAQRLGQPQVMGEIIAGILLGPSIFGLFFPQAQTWLFPQESKPILFAICQVGLAIFMFLVGLEFDFDLIKTRLRSAAAVSISGIIGPFLLGVGAAYFLMESYPFFSPQTSTLEGMLFLGAAMSITAFPVLARIISDRRLTGTSVGTLTLAAGSIDDAAAWCILAIVLASFAGDANIAIWAIGGGLAYVALVALVIRPLVRRTFKPWAEKQGTVDHTLLSLTLGLVMLGSWFTDAIGIYAVFGAFILGMAMPRGLFAEDLHRKLLPITSCLLVPLFFVYSGLNTRITLINSWNLVGVTLLILVLAITGKGVVCAIAARLNGETLRNSIAVGALMNARGLMELIILNIGLERGVITPTLFTIMVMMAILTTLMATPIFDRVYKRA